MLCISIQNSPKLVRKGSVDNKSALIHVMAWCRTAHYLNQCRPSPATHICSIRVRIVKWLNIRYIHSTIHRLMYHLLYWTNVTKTPHYNDVIMTTIASQITSLLMVVYWTVYSDPDQRKHQSSASLAFVWGIHRDRWIPRTKGQLRGKSFHLMTSSWGTQFSDYSSNTELIGRYGRNAKRANSKHMLRILGSRAPLVKLFSGGCHRAFLVVSQYIGSGNHLVPSGGALPETMLIQIYVAI